MKTLYIHASRCHYCNKDIVWIYDGTQGTISGTLGHEDCMHKLIEKAIDTQIMFERVANVICSGLRPLIRRIINDRK